MSADENNTEEWFELVDDQGRKTGRARRRDCHSNPALMHKAVHVLVFNPEGELFLQKRSARKDIQPGKWDTSVGGHLSPGESPQETALRETREELGVDLAQLKPLYSYIWRTEVETELIHSFISSHPGPFTMQASEIDKGRFWTRAELSVLLTSDECTPNFKEEYRRYLAWCERERSLLDGLPQPGD